MANELALAGGTTGTTIVAQVRRDSDELIWNTATSIFETYSPTHAANGQYDVTMTEQDSSGYFVGSFPTSITTSGLYNVTYNTRTGTAGSYSYISQAAIEINWLGTGVNPLPTGIDWISLSEYKSYIGYSGTDRDTEFAANITMASAVCNKYIGRTIKATDHVKIFFKPHPAFINLGQYPVNSISEITTDFTGGNLVVAPSDVIANELGTIRFTSQQGGSFDGKFVKVSFNAGYQIVPQDLKLAAILVTKAITDYAQTNDSIQQKSVKDVAVTYRDYNSLGWITGRAKMILDMHRIPVGF